MSRGRGRGRGQGRFGGVEISDDLQRLVEYKEIPLFPEYEPQIPKEFTQQDELYVQEKQRYLDLMHKLPYRLEPAKPRPTFEKYSDKHRREKTVMRGLQDMPFHPDYLAPELRLVWDPAYKRAYAQAAASRTTATIDLKLLDALMDEAEKTEGGTNKKGIEIHDDDVEGFGVEDDDFDEDLEGEYITNFYDDEFDAFDDEGGEDGVY